MSPFPSDEVADTPAPPKERRFKLSRACDRCRRRRIKCDEGHPCQSCLSSHSPCTFEEPGKRTQHSKSKRTSTLEERMHHLETLIQSIPSSIFEATSQRNGSDFNGDIFRLQSHKGSSESYPPGVPPPALSVSALTNPSTHFTPSNMPISFCSAFGTSVTDHLAEANTGSSISHSYMYFDEQGCKRWQGETSGLPLLDILFDLKTRSTSPGWATPPADSPPAGQEDHAPKTEWFPDRVPSRVDVNPETLWKVITSCISPDLMDTLVQCYLSTSYYLLPFLHVPTFLADYGNPVKWGEPGFASFILSICCLSSRHIDDPRVRSDSSDPSSVGTRWFELFSRLRTLPTADRPTLYTVQSVLVAAVYAVGLGKLSKTFALLSEAVTLSFDAGLHRSVDAYDGFDPIEDEVRRRTFWCVYIWDKQAGVAFGRPPLLRLRDCDVPEPAIVDDEFITTDGIGPQPAGSVSRMGAFVATLRYYVVLESLLDLPPSVNSSSSFLARVSSSLSGFRRNGDMREEEMIIDELRRTLPRHWAHSSETLASDDVLRVTQCFRLHCLERFIMLLIYRHRLSNFIVQRTRGQSDAEPGLGEKEAIQACYSCAREIIGAYLQTASKGLMTYYGVHVIHQLTQAGRTLIAVVLSLNSADLQSLAVPSLEALRSCVSLLRRFSGRYICGLRNGDLLEEFCRLSQIPLDAPAAENESSQNRPPWLRPVKKRNRTPSTQRSTGSSEPHDLADVSLTTTQSSPTYSHASPDDPFLPMQPDTDVELQYRPAAPSSNSVGTPELSPHELFQSDTQGSGISPTDIITLLNEGSWDVSTLFSPSAGMIDMFPASQSSGNDMGIISTP